jgi:outer membrane lipoprotein LolB
MLTVISLSACSIFQSQQHSTFPDQESTYNWQETQQQLEALTRWKLIGKIGIKTPSESMTAAINQWSQSEEAFVIDLSSTFFGLGASQLLGTPHFLTISESGEDPISSYQPNELIEQALGFPLPITHLPRWIKGLPIPDKKYDIRFNAQGLPESLTQDEWTLEYSKYMLNNGVPLPGKIKLYRNGTRIILAIKQWTLL